MADLIPDEDLQDQEDTLTPEQVQEALEAERTAVEPTPTDDDVPEKYHGKSIKEVITMHQEAERALGRQSGEVGELRGIVDDFIRRQGQQQPTAPQEPTPESTPDFYEDPEAAVSHAVQNHPDVVAAREATQSIQRSQAAHALNQAHPDAAEIISTPEFAEYIKSSPVRTELFVRADKQFDYAAADELLSGFKTRTNTAKATAEADAEARRDQLNRAATGPTKGSAASTGGRKYKRRDIIRLMRDDPKRYESLQDEITLAYAEGRVIS